ncbi:MAG: hypothetical protein WBX25_37615 [Rhodomicrobium sp.]
MTVARSKADERYAEIRKREQNVKQELETAARVRAEKTARLRQLRLAKEAEEAAVKKAAKETKTGKSKKPRHSSIARNV